MSEWKEYTLLELCEIHDTKRKPISSTEREKIKGSFPYYGASGIVGYINDYIFSYDTILISEDGENLNSRKTPIAFRATGKYWVNNHAHVLLPKSEHYFPIIINYLEAMDLNSYITGAVQPKLSQENLLKITITMPAVEEEQRAIAGVLSSLDDKIDLLHRQNKTLEGMAAAVFRHFLVDNRKATWQECTVSGLADHEKTSIHPNRNPATLFYHYSIPAFDESHMPVHELGALIQSNKYEVMKNTILFSKLNPHKDKRVWLIPSSIAKNSVCSTEFQVMNPKAEKYLFFLYSFISHPGNYDEIAAGVGGTSGSHQRIDPEVIFRFMCFLPDDNTLTDYNEMVEQIFGKMHHNRKSIQTLIHHRDTLLPKLMSGEVSVKV